MRRLSRRRSQITSPAWKAPSPVSDATPPDGRRLLAPPGRAPTPVAAGRRRPIDDKEVGEPSPPAGEVRSPKADIGEKPIRQIGRFLFFPTHLPLLHSLAVFSNGSKVNAVNRITTAPTPMKRIRYAAGRTRRREDGRCMILEERSRSSPARPASMASAEPSH